MLFTHLEPTYKLIKYKMRLIFVAENLVVTLDSESERPYGIYWYIIIFISSLIY